jgi:hypothetical protein
MKITRDNYEIWFLDYLEGRLDHPNMEEVRHFLLHHPDLADELDAISISLSIDQTVRFPDKEKLKRDSYDDAALFETWAVAAAEGDLKEEETIAFERWLDKRAVQKEFIRQLKLSKLEPNLEVTFPNKRRLKKKTTVIAVWIKVTAVAAILLIALFLFYPETKNQKRYPITISETTMPPVEIPSASNIPTGKSTVHATLEGKTKQTQVVLASRKNVSRSKTKDQPLKETRQMIPVEMLTARLVTLYSYEPVFNELVLIKIPGPYYAVTNKIPLSEFLRVKLQALKANGPKGFFSREELAVAGLRFFSRLPGNRLTGEKGSDGKLKSISFDTKILAFSIPVNR